MSAAELPSVSDSPLLRPPAHRVSPRAVTYWRVTAAVRNLVVVAIAVTAYVLVSSRPWWATALLFLLVGLALIHVLAMPTIRFRVHRYEVNPIAVHTRTGWIGRETRIAPLSRIQTVDSHQGAIMRLFNLASLTVTTASSSGAISIDCLDQDLARELVAQLTEITAASEGDAT